MGTFVLVAVAGMSVASSASSLVGLWMNSTGTVQIPGIEGSPSSSTTSSSQTSTSTSTPSSSSAPQNTTCDKSACDAAIKSAIQADADFSSSSISACAACPTRTFKYNDDNTAKILSKTGCPDFVTPGSISEADRQTMWMEYLSVSNSSCDSPKSSSGATLAPSLTKTACAAAIEKKMKESLNSSCGDCSGGNTCWNEFSTLPECSGCGGSSFGMCYGGDGKPAWFKKMHKTYGEVSDDTKSFSTKSASDLKWSKWFMENGYLETCAASTPSTASAQSGRTRGSTRTTSKTVAPKKITTKPKNLTPVPTKTR